MKTSDASKDDELQCEPFRDEQGDGTPVTIEIRNTRDEAVLLPDPCNGPDYVTLASAQGSWPQTWCSSTCEVGDEPVCGPCADSAYIFIAPGGSHTLQWSGLLFETTSPPDNCFAGGDACQVRRIAATGASVHATVVAAALSECEAAAEDPSACSCTPDESGSCSTSGTAVDATLMGETEFEVGETTVVIELE